MNYTFFKDLSAEVGDLPADSIVSRTIYQDDDIKAVLPRAGAFRAYFVPFGAGAFPGRRSPPAA